MGKGIWFARLAVGLLLACSALFFVQLWEWPAFSTHGIYKVWRYLEGVKANVQTRNFSTMETGHFVIKFIQKDKPYVQMVADNAEEVYGPVTDFFGYYPGDKTVVVVYPDGESLAASFGWDRDEQAMGVYWAGTIRILSPGEWISTRDTEDVFKREGPMAHELTHLLVDNITKGNYNRWFTEGVAQYVERRVTGFSFAEPSPDRQLRYYEFELLENDFDSLDQRLAYWQSLVAVECIVDKAGKEGLLQVMKALGDGCSFEEAIKKGTGMDFDQFAREVYFRLDHNLG